jgi:hypothetical protein
MPEAQTQTQARPPAVVVGGNVAALIPQNLDEAFRVATAFHRSGLAPSSFKTAEAILVSIMAGAELGFAPYQSMQSFAVINGRAAIWGDAIPALLWSRGFDLEEWWEGEGDKMVAYVKLTRPSGKEVTRTFSVDDARLANLLNKDGPWKTARKRMLQMRARAFAARDGAADVLRGLPVYEEVADFQPLRDVTPERSGVAARLAANKAGDTSGFAAADHDPQTGEIVDAEFEEPTSPSNRDLSAGGEASSEAGPQAEASPAGTGSETPADRERQSQRPDGEEQLGSSREADDFPGDREPFDAVEWASQFHRGLEEFESVEALNSHTNDPANQARFRDLDAAKPELAKGLLAAVNGRRKALQSRERGK